MMVAFQAAPGSRLVYVKKQLDEYRVCAGEGGCGFVAAPCDGIGEPHPGEACGAASCTNYPHCEGTSWAPLRVDQRPLTWGEEAQIVAEAALPNGRLNPGVVLGCLVRFTTRNPNFPLTEQWLRNLEDRDLGWHLCQWLGVVDFTTRLTPDAAGKQREEARKKW